MEFSQIKNDQQQMMGGNYLPYAPNFPIQPEPPPCYSPYVSISYLCAFVFRLELSIPAVYRYNTYTIYS